MNKNITLAFFAFLLLICPIASSAYQISGLANIENSGDYVIGPGKNEVSLNPGEQQTKEITVLNRSGKDLNFSVEVEDFYAASNGQEAIEFSNNQINPYPIKNLVIPEVSKFSLKHGEKMILPVLIRIPKEVSPGGLYGAVMISAQSTGDSLASQVSTATRLASLFFIRVNGEISESGQLENFSIGKSFYNRGPIDFSFVFRNQGNIYLNPHGDITISNLWGQTVYKKPISPYFVMPNSTRQQKEIWQSGGRWGIYKATLSLSRGYGEVIDRQSENIYIFPWVSLIIGGLAVLVLFWLATRVLISYKK